MTKEKGRRDIVSAPLGCFPGQADRPGRSIHVVVAAVAAAAGFFSSPWACRRSGRRWSAAGSRRWRRSGGPSGSTLVGSMMPALTMSPYSSLQGVVAEVALALGDLGDDHAAVLAGVLGDLVDRGRAGADDDLVADLLVVGQALGLDGRRGAAAGRRRRRAGCLPRRPRGWRAGRPRRGPSSPSSRSRSRRRR